MEENFNLEAELNARTTESVEDTGVNEQSVAEIDTVKNDDGNSQESGKSSYYANMRRKQDNDALRRRIAELESQNKNAQEILGHYFNGNDLQSQLDEAQAQFNGLSVEEVVRQRQRQAQVTDLQTELDFYRKKEVQRQMESDLRDIQKIDPTVASLEDLPPEYLALRFNNVAPLDARTAFATLKSIQKTTNQQKPPSMGSVTSTGGAEKEYYTASELDKLTKADLNDPKVLEKAMRSMELLK